MPTVVQPSLPIADVTPLEALVLGHVFEFERDGDAVYFFAETGPSDQIEVPVAEIRAALETASGVTSRTADLIRASLLEDMTGGDYLVLDLSESSWEFIFQDVIRRSASLDHVTIVSAQTCSRMRPDGFGGMAVVVTADFIKSKSTDDIVCELLDEAEHGLIAPSDADPAEGGDQTAVQSCRGLVLNVPEFFADPDFRRWLESDAPKFTWHRPGPPNEWSDVVVLVDPGLSGEGSDSDMPAALWNRIIEACRSHLGVDAGQACHYMIRLTNLPV